MKMWEGGCDDVVIVAVHVIISNDWLYCRIRIDDFTHAVCSSPRLQRVEACNFFDACMLQSRLKIPNNVKV